MEKYRIVQLFHNANSLERDVEWVIEQKKFWGCSEIFHVEGPTRRRISHNSYDKAEQYLLKKYTGHGICKRYGSFYTYEHYRYNY